MRSDLFSPQNAEAQMEQPGMHARSEAHTAHARSGKHTARRACRTPGG